jgi:hypothetical protein
VCPYFFDGTVTGESYLEMLREVVLPELENSPLYDNTEIIWQQDGASPHYSLQVREFLNNCFPEWIGQRGTVDTFASFSTKLRPFFTRSHSTSKYWSSYKKNDGMIIIRKIRVLCYIKTQNFS